MKQWYEELFENYADQYDQEVFVKGTLGECDFIEREIDFQKKISILDIGCGTGRHSIELTKRGYQVIGVDLSENMLQKARNNAKEANLTIPFKQAVARNLSFKKKFDLFVKW